MSHVRVRRTALVLLLLAVLVPFAQAQEDVEPIKIGLYAPMTGPIAFLGEGCGEAEGDKRQCQNKKKCFSHAV